MDRKTMLQMHGIIGLLGSGVDFTSGSCGEPPISVRPCINCGKEKQHNNAFCSSECSKEHKKKKV